MNKVIKKIIFKILMFFGIIVGNVIFFVSGSDLRFDYINIDIGNRTYQVMTDCMALHFYLSDYNFVEYHTQSEPTYPMPVSTLKEYKQQGYGRYHIKDSSNMFAFVKYCLEKKPGETENAILQGVNIAKANIKTTTIENYNTFYSFCSSVSLPPDVKYFIAGFWSSMKNQLNESFNRLQDSFILERYVFPALNKLNVSKSEVEGDDGKELLTVLTTYLMSTRLSEDLNMTYNSTVNKGDLLPFIYNIGNANSPYELAKFAYIYMIEGFGDEEEKTEGISYWIDEYELVFDEPYEIGEEDRDILSQFASKAQEKYGDQIGNKGIKLKGATEEKIIKSEYSIETKLEAIR
ncbi:MAG: hypothetical protein IKP66_02270, partial [Lachnospiraceae bacterium]|nr:hypothetical protein [Lachnospiraceae bacterium]